MGDTVKEYQRNVAFVAFIAVVCFAAFIYTAETLRDVLVPLVWSAFFAVPLIALISMINAGTIRACSWLKRVAWGDGGSTSARDAVSFRAVAGQNCIIVERNAATTAVLDRLNGPCGGPWGAAERSCDVCSLRRQLLQCCECRVRISSLSRGGAPVQGSEVNRLVQGWGYFVADHYWLSSTGSEGGGEEAGAGTEIRLQLFLDQAGQYPAVLAGTQSAEAGEVTGTFELDKTSALSWCCAILAALVIMLSGVYVFISCINVGVKAVRDNAPAYERGIKEFIHWIDSTFETMLPPGTWNKMQGRASTLAESVVSQLASTLVSNFQYIGWQALIFVIYLLFWIFEPLPVGSSVAQVFKTYLLLKTAVCALYAALMSGLLYFLHCPLWHLFFVITFLLNYIPEIGAITSAVLMVPAVLFDGNVSLEQRRVHLALLVIFGTLFKVVTGNIVEVQMYSTMGGQHMRMHPVMMLALMMLCQELLGVTGMFLAIPIVAAVKYYMVSTDMPEVFLNPLLRALEGDEAGPHKNFVDRHVASYGTLVKDS